MGNITGAVGLLILDQLLDKDISFTGKAKAGKYLVMMSGFFVFLAAVLFVFSTYQWLEDSQSTQTAAAVSAAVALGLAALFSLSALGILSFQRNRLKKMRQGILEELHKAFDYLEEALIAAPVQENPKTAALFASVAGFAAGEKFL